MYKDYDNYRTYENDDLSAGATLKVEHTIIVNETDILNLISQPLEKIQSMQDGDFLTDGTENGSCPAKFEVVASVE